MTTGALERAIRKARERRAEAYEHCEICGQLIGDRHRHLLDTEQGRVMCTCPPCSLLFNRSAASQGHYRLVPDRRLRVPAVSTKQLGVPVGLAYFVRRDDGVVTAHYPSPAGATAWEVDADAWQQLIAECPPAGQLAAEVEALLVNTARGQRQHWIVPIDDCFRLVAIIRTRWQGLSGGSKVWPEVDRFFADLQSAHP